MASEADVESEIQAKGFKAPRLSPADIERAIVSEKFHVFPGTSLTVCVLTLRNGHKVVGESAPVDDANFDEAIGQRVSRDRARQKIWELEGYLMRQRIYDAPASPQNHVPPAARHRLDGSA